MLPLVSDDAAFEGSNCEYDVNSFMAARVTEVFGNAFWSQSISKPTFTAVANSDMLLRLLWRVLLRLITERYNKLAHLAGAKRVNR